MALKGLTRVLLEDLYVIRIHDSTYASMKFCLLECFPKVNINGGMSDVVTLQYGVLQLSFLSPVLFTIYARSFLHFGKHVASCTIFYADGTQFYTKTENVGDAKERVVALMSDVGLWMRNHRLKLHDKKTDVIIILG